MTILLVGLNHRTAPVELREKLSLAGCALPMALKELGSVRQAQNGHHNGNGHGHVSVINEGVILSTCNRLEVYVSADSRDAGWEQIDRFLATLQNLSMDAVRPHLYHLDGADAVAHLMRVACGLDSMILGEPQILGQVTQAYTDAQNSGNTGPILSHLFSQAIHAGKRARAETDISRFTTSVSHAGALMVMEKVATPDPNILVIGAGEMAVLAAKSVHNQGVDNLRFVNRTFSRAEALAAEVGGEALSWHQLPEGLTWADAVITATGAPHTVLFAEDIAGTLTQRDNRPLLLVDIAVPRDIEVACGDLDGVERCDIDDLQFIVDSNNEQRQAAIPSVEAIITNETVSFFEWYHSREVTPVIKDLRQWALDLAQSEVRQALNKLGETDKQTEKIVTRLAHRIVNKMLHEPTSRLRDQAAEGNGQGYAHAISKMFGLHALDCDMKQAICENKANGSHDASCNLQCIVSTKSTDRDDEKTYQNGHARV